MQKKPFYRNYLGYSLIETMTVLAVLGIVTGLLYAYSDQGWKLFYQSYSRGLSQIKAKIAIKVIQEELLEANKSRIAIGRGTTYGAPFPDDIKDSSPFIYFTKPKFHEGSGEIIGYDYVFYYFAKLKSTFEPDLKKQRLKPKEDFLILKSIKFTNQSKFYTEDKGKNWPFLPPILELRKSTLPEDEAFKASLDGEQEGTSTDYEDYEKSKNINLRTQDQFLDHYSNLKKDSKNIPISGNFLASSLTDPFSSEEVNIFFGQDYKTDKPVKIKVALEEAPLLFSLMSAMTEFEVKITPRN